MVEDAAKRVTGFLRNQLGEELRTVVIVREQDYDIEYLNNELQRRYSTEAFTKVVDTFRLKQPMFAPEIEESLVGDRRAVVHYHEYAFVVQFPFSETETILISVSRDVGRALLDFIERCRQLVHAEE